LQKIICAKTIDYFFTICQHATKLIHLSQFNKVEMKKIVLSILTICAVTQIFAQVDRSKRPTAGPAPVIKMGTPSTFTLPNGLKVYVVENHKLPTVTYQLDLDIYPALQGKAVGYKDFVGELMTAGTKTRTKDQFNNELDGIGARISAGSDGFYASSLTKTQEQMLGLLGDMIMNPNFTDDELAKLKTETISGLQTNQDDPDAMSGNITRAMIFGDKHLYGEIPTEQTVNNITLADCKKFYATYYRPNVSYLAVVGDITPAQAKILVTKYFGKWQKGIVPVATYATPATNKGARVAICNKPGAVQSVVDVTYPIDIKPGSPDLIPLRVANNILGGGSSGRLFQNLREEHGWTYGSYSSVSEDALPNSGTFSATAKCRTEVTDSSVREIIAEMQRLRTEPVNDKDLKDIKSDMAGKFALGLEDPRTLARYAINTVKYKLPADYYTNYLKNLSGVTAADILRVSKKYITPGVAAITVAGDKNEIAEKLRPLSATGKIEYFDAFGGSVTDEPVKIAKDVTAQSVLQAHIKAVGGADAWKNIRDVTTNMELAAGPQKVDLVEIKKAPNKSFSTMKMGAMVLQKSAFDGTKGYQEVQGQKADMTEEEIAEAKDDAAFQQEIAYLGDGYKLELAGTDKVDGKDCYIVKVTKPNGKVSTNYYEIATGLKLKSSSVVDAQGQSMTISMIYSDYQDVKGGLKYPFKMKQAAGPQNFAITVKSIELNTDVKDEVFQ
jgi:zinc protease